MTLRSRTFLSVNCAMPAFRSKTAMAMQKGMLKLPLQGGLRHRVNERVGNVGIRPHVDGFDIFRAQIVLLDQVQNQVLRRMRERTGWIWFNGNTRRLHKIRMSQ